MAAHIKERFANRRIDIDGNRFEDCEFEQCEFVYSGGEAWQLIRCKIAPGCKFSFAGSAAKTLDFFRTLYHSNPAGLRIIESMFNTIRTAPSRINPLLKGVANSGSNPLN